MSRAQCPVESRRPPRTPGSSAPVYGYRVAANANGKGGSPVSERRDNSASRGRGSDTTPETRRFPNLEMLVPNGHQAYSPGPVGLWREVERTHSRPAPPRGRRFGPETSSHACGLSRPGLPPPHLRKGRRAGNAGKRPAQQRRREVAGGRAERTGTVDNSK